MPLLLLLLPQVVLQLKDVNAQLEAALQRLQGRGQQVAAATAGQAALAACLSVPGPASTSSLLPSSSAGVGSPAGMLAAPPGSAAKPEAVGQHGGGGGPLAAGMVDSTPQPFLLPPAGAPNSGQAMSLTHTGVPDTPSRGLATALIAEEAYLLVQSAMSEARCIVDTCRCRPPHTGVDTAASPGGATAGQEAEGGEGGGPGSREAVAAEADGQENAGVSGRPGLAKAPCEGLPCRGKAGAAAVEESWLNDVIMGCVGMLFTVQKCTVGPMNGPVVEQALDLAVRSLQPHAEGNQVVYQVIDG